MVEPGGGETRKLSQLYHVSLDLDELLDVIIDALIVCYFSYDEPAFICWISSSQEIERMVVYGYEVSVDQDEILK